MTDVILVLNAGSSSLKATVCAVDPAGGLAFLLRCTAEELTGAARFRARGPDGATVGEHVWTEPPGHAGALDWLIDWLRRQVSEPRLVAVGHRVVHGGEAFPAPVRVDAGVIRALDALVPLAPLHQPHNLAPIRRLHERHPEIVQVACFDTAFHRQVPEVAQAFALPRALTETGVRRYGFHGLSYEYIASILPRLDPAAAAGRTVVLHLGNGASLCALKAGRSVGTTMGFTALDGLMMGTRCGALDPGVVLYMVQQLGMTADAVEDMLYRRSGLLGVSGLSSDMRTLLASDDPQARFAIELYVYRIVRELGGLVAALEGLDALVFTAGVGENAPVIRAMILDRLGWLGVRLDPAANVSGGPRISASGSAVSVWVAPTDEEGMIATHTMRLAR